MFVDKQAIEITGNTLIGADRKFPYKRGNCFDVKTDDDCEYRILNFNVENLNHLLSHGLTWPVKILVLSEHCAVINDSRIDDDLYDTEFCEVCTPRSLLPVPQRLKQLRDIDKGVRVETDNAVIYNLNPKIIRVS